MWIGANYLLASSVTYFRDHQLPTKNPNTVPYLSCAEVYLMSYSQYFLQVSPELCSLIQRKPNTNKYYILYTEYNLLLITTPFNSTTS